MGHMLMMTVTMVMTKIDRRQLHAGRAGGIGQAQRRGEGESIERWFVACGSSQREAVPQ